MDVDFITHSLLSSKLSPSQRLYLKVKSGCKKTVEIWVVYKTWARPWPGPWPTLWPILWPTLWPTQNFAVFKKIARSGKFSQNIVKRGIEPAEDCRNHKTGYCATVKCDAFRQWLQWAKKQDYLYPTLGNNDPWH